MKKKSKSYPKLKKYPTGGIKYGFNPETRVHTLGPGEQPYNDAKLSELGLTRYNPNDSMAKQAGDDMSWYKVVPYGTQTQQPYRSHARQMAENPQYRKQYMMDHPSIPTFAFGGDTSNPADPNRPKEEEVVNTDSNFNMNNMSGSQYATMGAGAIQGGSTIGGAYSNPSATDTDKGEAIGDGVYQAGTGVVGAINPALGGLMGAAGNFGKQQRAKNEAMDENGNLIDRDKAIRGHAIGTFMSPSKSLANVMTNKDAGIGRKIAAGVTGGLSEAAFGNKYADKIQEDAKLKIEEEKAQQELQNPTYKYGGYGVPKNVYPYGGIPNAEIEKQELMRMPNGSTEQVNGPSHENGGVPVSIPTGTQIYSDRLKHPETGKTFAKEAGKYKIIEAKNGGTLSPTQKLINDVRQKKLDSIFNAQEKLKQDKVNNYAKKMGVTLGTQDPRVTGGMDITNPSSIQDTPQMYANGGTNPELTDEGYVPTNFNYDFDPFLKSDQGIESTSKDYSNEIGLGANIIGQNVGNIADLAMTKFGKKYDKEDFGKVKPQYLDPTESLRAADTEATITRNRLKDATSGNAAAYLANLTGAQTANTLNKAQIRNQFENQNKAIYNQADQTNLGLKNQAKAAEQQNKARSEDIARSAVRGAGTNTAAAIKDYNMGKMDKRSLDIISKAYPDYEYNTKTRNWEHKVTKEKLKV